MQVVQDTKAEMAERNDELLSSFNVATFKSDEDDQAFWNRLIPVDQRVKEQPPEEHLGIRQARLKPFEDVRTRCADTTLVVLFDVWHPTFCD